MAPLNQLEVADGTKNGKAELELREFCARPYTAKSRDLMRALRATLARRLG